MIKRVIEIVESKKMIYKNDNIILGLSGGSDSVTLFHILRRLKDIYKFDLEVVHINHGIRDESYDDAIFCENLCKEYGVQITVYNIDIKDIAKKENISIEECGRNKRRQCYDKHFKENRCNKIALGHNLNDVAETFLMQLIRGSGVQGLGSIRSKTKDIIRPLIEINKKDIEDFCKLEGYRYVVDKTNFTMDYERNRIRNHLIPLLEQKYSKKIVNTINRTSKILEEENKYLEQISKEKFEQLKEIEENSISLNIKNLKREHKAIRKRIVRHCIHYMNKTLKGITFRHTEQVIELLNKENGKSINLPSKLIVKKNYTMVKFYKETKKTNKQIELEINKKYYIEQELFFLSINDKKITINENEQLILQKQFYSEKNLPFILRSRAINDKIYFKTLGGNKSIKKYFIDEKIPKETRENILLIAQENKVLIILDSKKRQSNLFFDIGTNNTNKKILYLHIWRKKNGL